MKIQDYLTKQRAAENRARMQKEKAQAAPRKPYVWPKAHVRKPSTWEIYQRVLSAISNAFPDGDPIDALGPWMERNEITMKMIDKAVRANTGAKSYNAHLADMWDDTAADRIYDAKNGYVEENSVFYSVGEDGAILPADNPWRP